MIKQTLKVKLTFTEPLLGSQPGNKDVHSEFIASRVTQFKGEPAKTPADSAEETEAINPEEEIEKATTIFAGDEHGLLLWDYQLRGFIKEGIQIFIELGECKLSMWNYKRSVDQFVFVRPRRIYLLNAKGDNILKADEYNERPLRASTMKGDRIALARSQMLPIGTQCEVEFECRLPGDVSAQPKVAPDDDGADGDDGGKKKRKPRNSIAQINRDLIIACLDYNKDRGFGQWRSGGWGRYDWEELK